MNQTQRALEDAFPRAKRLVSAPPFPSLIESLRSEVSKLGFDISLDEARNFAETYTEKKPPKIDHTSTNNIVAKKSNHIVSPRNGLPPTHTECRFSYKGQTHNGKIVNNELIVTNYGRFTSLSTASKSITTTSRNGWRDWNSDYLIRINGYWRILGVQMANKAMLCRKSIPLMR